MAAYLLGDWSDCGGRDSVPAFGRHGRDGPYKRNRRARVKMPCAVTLSPYYPMTPALHLASAVKMCWQSRPVAGV